MTIKKLRANKALSQEQLAETTGISLRTVQRAESGHHISQTSLKILADYFGVSLESLTDPIRIENAKSDITGNRALKSLNGHRAAQLIIFVSTFFVCVAQWLAYYANITPGTSDASLWTILSYVSQIAIVAAVFTYIFNHAKVTFIWGYYATTAAFVTCSIGLQVWNSGLKENANALLLNPAFFTLMLFSLLVFHVLQMALSLKGESVVLVQEQAFARR